MFTAIKRVQEFQCIQYNGTNSEDLLAFIGEHVSSTHNDKEFTVRFESKVWMMGIGEWVVRDSLGEVDMLFKDEFNYLYEIK